LACRGGARGTILASAFAALAVMITGRVAGLPADSSIASHRDRETAATRKKPETAGSRPRPRLAPPPSWVQAFLAR
jgi:hypothetical protein